MMSIRAMLTCRWSARHIQRYLDADPSAPLEPADVRRLEEHLATCEKCSAAAQEYRGLSRALARWAQSRLPDRAAVDRMHAIAENLIAQDVR